jgi:hypothetical protein
VIGNTSASPSTTIEGLQEYDPSERGSSGTRFIHSSDLQIGKVFGFLKSDVATLLQVARQAVVGTLGENGAAAVLLAADVYDEQQLSGDARQAD